MPVQLPSFGSDVPESVKRSLESLAAAVNRLEGMLPTGDDRHGEAIAAMRGQIIETASRVDDLTRRVRVLES